MSSKILYFKVYETFEIDFAKNSQYTHNYLLCKGLVREHNE